MKDREQIIDSVEIAFNVIKEKKDMTLLQAIDELTRAILQEDYGKEENPSLVLPVDKE